MTLLQIREPTSPLADPPIVLGIDLGTTNSLAAIVRGGRPSVLPISNGDPLLPSAIHYAETGILVGAAALVHRLDSPEYTFMSIKRFLGRSWSEIEAAEVSVPYKKNLLSDTAFQLATPQGWVDVIQITSELLKEIKANAEAYLQQPVERVVITVPAYFNDRQRQATRNAASLAGLHVLRLLSEPTAAALAYGLNKLSLHLQYVAVYDLGGGTFDFSLLQVSNGLFEVVATAGDTALGGDDIDTAIALWIKKQAELQDVTLSMYEMAELLNLAQSAKKSLSQQKKVVIQYKTWEGALDESMLQSITALLLEKTFRLTMRALKDANVEINEIETVILVGGSTKLPLIRQQVSQFFKQEPLRNLDPEQTVALGAAIHADRLAGNCDNFLLLDVTPLSLGIETSGGLVEKIILRNSTLPISATQIFTPASRAERSVMIHVLQGESEDVKACQSLGRFSLENLYANGVSAVKIEVTFSLDADGILTVSAQEANTENSVSITMRPAQQLTQETLITLLQPST